jgi:putative transposase
MDRLGESFGLHLSSGILIEQWRREYNHIRLHSSLGYRLPVPEAILSEIIT